MRHYNITITSPVALSSRSLAVDSCSDFNILSSVVVKLQYEVNKANLEIQRLATVNKLVADRLEFLEDEHKLSKVNMNEIFIRIDSFEQEKLSNSLEIFGVDFMEGENLMDRVVDIGYMVGIVCTAPDIDYIFRRPNLIRQRNSSTMALPIIVFFLI